MEKKKIFYISFLLVFVLILSSCSFKGSDNTDTNLEDEILLAQECGEEGLACCVDKDPVCKYGDCCYDPNNPKNNYCSESCEFGKEDTFCGPGNTCDVGMACEDSYCVPCGGVDQPCCGGDECSSDLACFRDTCVTCGLTDNPCCLAEPFCQTGGSKELNRAECKQEICSLCGANGNPACDVEPFCNENHLLNNGSCYRCGGFNQPCCINTDYEGTEKFCVEAGLECKLDFCSR